MNYISELINILSVHDVVAHICIKDQFNAMSVAFQGILLFEEKSGFMNSANLSFQEYIE